MLPVAQIKCPQGIRFECSCCSNCCLEWPVPLTAKDYERIQSQPGLTCATEALGSRAGSPGNLLSFSHILKKNAAGACEFLQPDKHCRIHIEQGAEAKPSMCRLFPYSFIVTPDEVLASVSFAASAVLSNSGRLLSHQPETLAEQYQLFQQLFAAPVSLWHKLQIIDGLPISWEEFCRLDIDALISGDCPDTETVPPGMIKKLALASAKVLLELPDKNAAEKEPRLESRPRIIDQILLKHLEKLYFPDQVFSETNYDLNARALMQELVSAPQAVSFGQADHSRKFADLIKIKLGKLPDDVEDLLNRFFYVRFFSRLFFGPGFHHFSLLSGLHHLRILIVLMRLKIKQALCLDSRTTIDFKLVAELVRTLERRLTQLDFSSQSLAMLEVMLASPARQERLLFLAE